jgi:hypothetical protein
MEEKDTGENMRLFIPQREIVHSFADQETAFLSFSSNIGIEPMSGFALEDGSGHILSRYIAQNPKHTSVYLKLTCTKTY